MLRWNDRRIEPTWPITEAESYVGKEDESTKPNQQVLRLQSGRNEANTLLSITGRLPVTTLLLRAESRCQFLVTKRRVPVDPVASRRRSGLEMGPKFVSR